MEDFFHDDRFAELLSHYDRVAGADTEVELILNGDIFDLLKIKIEGKWPTEITDEIATEKLKQCLEGHPRFVHSVREFLSRPNRRVTYLPGNHDLDMWFPGPQELFRRYVAPGDAADRVRFITSSDTYYLPEGIQIKHGHQLERIHRVDYERMVEKRRDGSEILALPWGTLWILEVMNPAKEERNYVDRIQPLGRFLVAGLLFDPTFVLRFLWRSTVYFLKYRIFTLRAWRERIRQLPESRQGRGDRPRRLRRGVGARAPQDARRTHADRRPQPRAALPAPAGEQAPGEHRHLDQHDQSRHPVPRPGQRPDLRAHRVQRRGQAADESHALARSPSPMRDGSLRRLIEGFLALALLACTTKAMAQEDARAELVIEPPAHLTVGDRRSVIVRVTIFPEGDRPVLLTPTSEGTAVEVVRGRLLRADAEDPSAPVLRFSIPILAATAGTSVLRVHVSGWACDERCRPVEADAEVILRVVRRPAE